MKSKFFGGLVIAALAITTLAEAQTRTPVINQRERNQESRIHQGERSGQLTHSEARNLQRRENGLQRQKMAARSDGYVSASERRHLKNRENNISRSIYRKKHNRRSY